MPDETMQLPRKVVWRRMDVEGLDACSYDNSDDGYRLSGTVIFNDGDVPAKVDYRVSCNLDWSSRSAQVRGWRGAEEKHLSMSRDSSGRWFMNRERIADVDGLLDIDLGFTPATNTNAIRRLGLAVGEEAETTAVWLDTEDWCVKPLKQVYRRLSETEFAYRSPSHDYTATLIVDDFGIVRSYPQLWTAMAGQRTRKD